MGYLRFWLMVAVASSHLMDNGIQSRVAVYGFFILSGFLLTLISNEVYENTLRGRMTLLANRFLRIYPTYWICYLVCLACIYATNLRPGICYGCHIPYNMQQWLADIFIFGQVRFASLRMPTLVNTGWSLANELAFYLVIGLVTGRSRLLTLIAYIGALCTAYYLKPRGVLPHDALFMTISGNAHVFFLGSLFYHFRHSLGRFCIRSTPLLLLLATAVIYWPERWPYGHLYNLKSTYLHLLPMGYIVLSLWHISRDRKTSRFEQWLADISYPAFLIHTLVGAAIVYQLTGTSFRSWQVFALGLAASVIISAVIVRLVDVPLKEWRTRLRQTQHHEKY